MFGENKKWFNTILKLYNKGKLEEPYFSLFDYYKDVGYDKENLLLKEASLSHYLYFHDNCHTKDLE
ncbi:MAG: hypothetical protein K2K31_02940, partial [Clostridia bacterium]|nr:hypothetical protein [Clostridia bacterium]